MNYPHKTQSIFIVVILAALWWVIQEFGGVAVQFRPFDQASVLATVSTMGVVALFMERSIESILIPVRAKERNRLTRAVKKLKEELKTDPGKAGALDKAKEELAAYRLGTARRANWISFGFGLVIAAAGVRVLAGLVTEESIAALATCKSHFIFNLFNFADCVLTGGAIAGGSAAIDKIGRRISGNLGFDSAVTPNENRGVGDGDGSADNSDASEGKPSL